MMSRSEQDTRKYCCLSRSSRPSSVLSSGYSTLLMFSDADDVLDRLGVLAGAEPGEVERLPAGPGPPQPDDVHRLRCRSRVPACGSARRGRSRPASSAGAARSGRRRSGRCGRRSRPPGGRPGAAELPRVAVERPVVGPLDLRAVAEGLLEDAEVVADAVADRGDVQRGHRVQQAGGEPAQAAVAEARLDVERRRASSMDSPRLAAMSRVQCSGAGVEQVLLQLPAQQVLGGQVVDEPRVGLVVRRHRARVPVDRAGRARVTRERVVRVAARWPTRSSCPAGSRGCSAGSVRSPRSCGRPDGWRGRAGRRSRFASPLRASAMRVGRAGRRVPHEPGGGRRYCRPAGRA